MSVNLEDGWNSQKLVFGAMSSGFIFLGWVMSARWPALQPQFMTFVGGVTGIMALYTGGNLGNKYVAGQHIVAMKALDSDGDGVPDAEPSPPGVGGKPPEDPP